MLGSRGDSAGVGLFGIGQFAHSLITLADEVSSQNRLVAFGPIIDHGLKPIADGRVNAALLNQAMAPHQLRVGRGDAAFIQRNKFFVLGSSCLVFALEIKPLCHLELITLHLAHLGEGFHGDLLEIR